MSVQSAFYEFTPAQNMINFMLKYSFFHKQVIQIPASVTFSKNVDFDIMLDALNLEIKRNDCMRLRFKKKKGIFYQSFLDEYKIHSVPIKSFKTKQEQEDFLNADACTPIHHMKGELYRFYFFNSYDGRKGIYINVSHLVMDAAAVFIFFSDLFACYDHLADGKDLPKPLGSFEEVVKNELSYVGSTAYNNDKKFFEEFFRNSTAPIFNGVHGPELLLKARQKKKNPNLRVLASFDPIHDKSKLLKRPVSQSDSEVILKYLDESKVSPECLVQLGMRLHIAKLNTPVNDGIIDTYFVTLCTRRKTVKEKRCGGSMTNTLPWRIILPRELTFEQAIEQLHDLQFTMFRHQDFSFTDWRDIENEAYNYSPADGTSTMMFSWFPLEQNTMNGWDYEFNGYSIGHYVMPLYTYAMKDLKNNSLKFSYMYRTQKITEKNIDDLHNNTVKALKLGCSNPKMTIGEIIDNL